MLLFTSAKSLMGTEGAKWAHEGCGTSATAVYTLSELVCVSFHLAKSKDMFLPVLNGKANTLLSERGTDLNKMEITNTVSLCSKVFILLHLAAHTEDWTPLSKINGLFLTLVNLGYSCRK